MHATRKLLQDRKIELCVLMFATVAGCTSFRFNQKQAGCDEILTAGETASIPSRLEQHKGVKYVDRGKLTHAARAFEHAIGLDFNNGSAHNNLGLVLFRQRQISTAADEFGIAARLMPDDPTPLNNLGMALEAGGRGEESLMYYDHAYQLAPDNPVYLGNLVRTRIRLGEADQSVIEQLKELQFIETRPDWLQWVSDQLVLKMNPQLDRGPPPPNLSAGKKKAPNSESQAAILEPVPQENFLEQPPIEYEELMMPETHQELDGLESNYP